MAVITFSVKLCFLSFAVWLLSLSVSQTERVHLIARLLLTGLHVVLQYFLI